MARTRTHVTHGLMKLPRCCLWRAAGLLAAPTFVASAPDWLSTMKMEMFVQKLNLTILGEGGGHKEAHTQ